MYKTCVLFNGNKLERHKTNNSFIYNINAIFGNFVPL